MWTYKQTTGQLLDKEMVPRWIGYSGHESGLNNPAMQEIPGIGPIPQGIFKIVGPPFHGTCGPDCLRLEPLPETNVFGRSDFEMHGDEIAHAGEHLASHGCIIMPHDARLAVWASGDLLLEVIE